MVQPIEPAELRRRMVAGEAFRLLDVREPFELEICALAGSLAIPMGDVPARADELDPDDPRPIVCVCHHGIRSARVAGYLEARGLTRLYNLSGGIDRWAEEVEPGMARY